MKIWLVEVEVNDDSTGVSAVSVIGIYDNKDDANKLVSKAEASIKEKTPLYPIEVRARCWGDLNSSQI